MYFVCVQKFSQFNNSTICKHQPNQDKPIIFSGQKIQKTELKCLEENNMEKSKCKMNDLDKGPCCIWTWKELCQKSITYLHMNSLLINGVHTHISISGYFRRKYAEIRKTGKFLFLTTIFVKNAGNFF